MARIEKQSPIDFLRFNRSEKINKPIKVDKITTATFITAKTVESDQPVDL